MKDRMELVSALFDDHLADEDFAELRAWLLADGENLREFVRESIIHSRIRDILLQDDVCRLVFDDGEGELVSVDPNHIVSLLDEEAEAARRRAAEEQARLDAEAAAQRRTLEALDRKTLRPEPRVFSNRWAYALMAAAATLLIYVGRLTTRDSLPPGVPAPRAFVENLPAKLPVIATIAQSLDAAWKDAGLSTAPETELTAGRLELASGVVEIHFSAGAKMVVEAPAVVELLTADRARLDSGRVVANVPQQALGFTLHSGVATFVDLGTEFGVEVRDTGEASVHVLDGEVALVPGKDKASGPSRTLQIGAASTVSADGTKVSDIPFDRGHFLRRVPASAYELTVRRSRPLAYWRLNEADGEATVLSSARIAGPGVVGQGVTLGVKSDRGGESAAFAGEHDGVDLGSAAALPLITNFTCEAWMLTTSRQSGPQRILSTFDRMPRTGFAFGVVDGPWYELPDGGLFVHFTAHGVYDSVSLEGMPSDAWTHIAAAVDPTGEPLLYINGKLVGHRYKISRKPIWIDGSDWDPSLRAVPGAGSARLGRNPLGADGKSPPERWQGQLSDVAVYDRALPAEEIRRHFEAGKSPKKFHSDSAPSGVAHLIFTRP